MNPMNHIHKAPFTAGATLLQQNSKRYLGAHIKRVQLLSLSILQPNMLINEVDSHIRCKSPLATTIINHVHPVINSRHVAALKFMLDLCKFICQTGSGHKGWK